MPRIRNDGHIDRIRIRNYSVEDTGNGEILCLEGYSGRYFYSSFLAVDEALRIWSDAFSKGEYVCFNDLYKLLGIAETHFGWQYGYPANEDYYNFKEGIEYECNYIHDPTLDRPIYCIDIYLYPMECWLEV